MVIFYIILWVLFGIGIDVLIRKYFSQVYECEYEVHQTDELGYGYRTIKPTDEALNEWGTAGFGDDSTARDAWESTVKLISLVGLFCILYLLIQFIDAIVRMFGYDIPFI